MKAEAAHKCQTGNHRLHRKPLYEDQEKVDYR